VEGTVTSDKLLATIAALPPGAKLPPERELVVQYSLPLRRVRQFLGKLEKQGVLIRSRKRGTFLSHDAAERLKTPVYLFETPLSAVKEASPNWWRLKADAETNRAIAGAHPEMRLEPLLPHWNIDRLKADGRPTTAPATHSIIQTLISHGICADLTDRLSDWEESKRIWPSLWEVVTRQGRTYGVPSGVHVFALFCNMRRMKECGLSTERLPRTWDEVAETAAAMTDPARDCWGIDIPHRDCASWFFVDLVLQAGGEIVTEGEHSWHLRFHEEPGVRALSFLKALRWERRVMSPFASSSDDAVDAFLSGKTGMCWMESTRGLNAIAQSGRPASDFEVAALPTGPSGHVTCQASLNVQYINAAAPDPETAWRYVQSRLTHATCLERSRRLWQHRVVEGWPNVYRDVTPGETGVGLPASWFRTLTNSLACARPEPYAVGWDSDLLLAPVVRRILLDAEADPGEELRHAKMLGDPKRFVAY